MATLSPWYSRIVILIRAAAKVGRRLHRIASRVSISELPIAILEACRDVYAATDGLRRKDCKLPIRKIPTGGGAGGGVCGCGRDGGRCGAGAAGRVGGIGVGFAGVEVGGEEGVVVIACLVQAGEGLFYDCCAEGVAFV